MIKRFFISPSVILDPRDNSVTFSKSAFKLIKKIAKSDSPKVFSFSVNSGFGFCLDPIINAETILADIQYNSKTHSVGFESLCPTVNKILYVYGLPSDVPVRLKIRLKTTANGINYFEYQKP